MAQLLFYEKPVPLNKDAHREFKIRTSENFYAFSKATNSVLLAGVEFVHASKEYGIMFAKAGERIVPVALLGLRNDENLYVDANGHWDARYIPAYVRRYPFVLADSPQGDGQMAVCVDESFSGFNKEEGQPLFQEDGEQAPLLTNAINFLRDYQGQYQRTEIFVNRLKDMDLFTEMSAQAELPDGQKVAMNGLMVVNEKKLLELENSKAMELFQAGELAWVYAHLFSLSNLQALADRLAKRSAAA